MSDRPLAPPPTADRAQELWLQHAIGHLLFRDVRDYARGRLPADLSDEQRRIAEDAIDHAVYGLMMLIDGVPGGLRNATHAVDLQFIARLREGARVIRALDLGDGDGMCMGFQGWREGDFGGDPVVE